MEFSKKYKTKNEKKIIELWEKNGVNSVQKDSKLWTSLPLSLGNELHLWQMFSYVLQDILLRHQRMQWVSLAWPLFFHSANFWQHIQYMHDVSEKWKPKISYNKHYQLLNDRYRKALEDLQSVGISFDKDHIHASFLEGNTMELRDVFGELYQKSLVYKSRELVYWDFDYQTLVWQDDVFYKTEKKIFYRIRYFIDTKKDCVIATTHTPETLFADVALAVNPMDKRYRKFVGKKVIIPIINKAIPLIADERVDMTKDDGVIRVVPGHDALSLAIAKDHNLDINLYAIGTDSKFTSLAGTFAGKNAKDFFDNIVQYLDDIANLDGTYEEEIAVPYCKKTWSLLWLMAMDQWFLRFSQKARDRLSDLLAFGHLKILPDDVKWEIEELLLQDMHMCISRQYKNVPLLPIARLDDSEDIFLDNDLLVDAFKQHAEKKKHLALTLVLFNLYLDGRLQRRFSLEEMIDVLWSASLSNANRSTLEVYIELLLSKTKFPVGIKKEFDQLLSYVKWMELKKLKLDKKNDLELAGLLDMLEESFLIEKAWNIYVLSLEWIVEKQKKHQHVKFSGLAFDSSFYSVVTPLETYDYSSVGRDNILLFVQKLLFALEETKDIPLETLEFHPILFEKRGRKMWLVDDELIFASAFVQEYGADVLRMLLVDTNMNEWAFYPDLSRINEYYHLVQKLWNAGRYIKYQVYGNLESQKGVNYTQIQKRLQKQVDMFDQFDLWICDVLAEFHEERHDTIGLEVFSNYINKLLDLIKNGFCGWYIEISKINKYEYRKDLLLWGMWTVLQYLHPLMPNVTEQLWWLLWFEGVLSQSQYQFDLLLPSKNYKVHLFLNIVHVLLTLKKDLGIYKHEPVLIFIQSSSDFLSEINDSEVVLQTLLNAEDIVYLRKHDIVPDGYETRQVIDILVGLTKHNHQSKRDERMMLEQDLEEKKEYLQYLRTLISSAAINGRPEIVAKKEEELETLKKEIETIQLQITKIKVWV